MDSGKSEKVLEAAGNNSEGVTGVQEAEKVAAEDIEDCEDQVADLD